MQFSSSLKLNHIFRRLYRKGQSAANGYLVLYCHKNGSRQNRIGLTVSAKLAHAVHRNRLRRQLREIYRLHEAQFARGYDIVVVARTRAIGADYAALEQELLEKINALDIGPQGFGGQTTALGVNIETYATHIAGLPVAVNISCHVTRRASAQL